jgi:hypothetical protein
LHSQVVRQRDDWRKKYDDMRTDERHQNLMEMGKSTMPPEEVEGIRKASERERQKLNTVIEGLRMDLQAERLNVAMVRSGSGGGEAQCGDGEEWICRRRGSM